VLARNALTGPRFSPLIRVEKFADGADVIDYLSEIPLPGRVLAPPHAPADPAAPRPASLGFVAGAENRLVASAVNRLMHAAPKGGEARLLALFGPSGTGKTHLALGLVRYWQEQRGDESALYLTTTDFYRAYVDAIKQDAVDEFRRSVREREMLAIDDLHQLTSNGRVSQELRHTLDAYEENGGTVLIASRRAPATLANLSPDVRSRLAAGVMLQLAPPGNAARVRIIRRAAEALGHPLSDAAANQLAKNVTGSANELFGALFEICASSSGGADGKKLAADRLYGARSRQRPNLREIVAAVGRYYRIPQAQLKSGSRRQSIVAARAMVIYLAREIAAATYEQFGRALGGRDHTTIIHSYRKIEQERAREPALQQAIDELRRMLVGHQRPMGETCQRRVDRARNC
jgi:chromosomal replication initiator protein